MFRILIAVAVLALGFPLVGHAQNASPQASAPSAAQREVPGFVIPSERFIQSLRVRANRPELDISKWLDAWFDFAKTQQAGWLEQLPPDQRQIASLPVRDKMDFVARAQGIYPEFKATRMSETEFKALLARERGGFFTPGFEPPELLARLNPGQATASVPQPASARLTAPPAAPSPDAAQQIAGLRRELAGRISALEARPTLTAEERTQLAWLRENRATIDGYASRIDALEARPILTPEERAQLAWLRDNQENLLEVIRNVDTLKENSVSKADFEAFKRQMNAALATKADSSIWSWFWSVLGIIAAVFLGFAFWIGSKASKKGLTTQLDAVKAEVAEDVTKKVNVVRQAVATAQQTADTAIVAANKTAGEVAQLKAPKNFEVLGADGNPVNFDPIADYTALAVGGTIVYTIRVLDDKRIVRMSITRTAEGAELNGLSRQKGKRAEARLILERNLNLIIGRIDDAIEKGMLPGIPSVVEVKTAA